MVAVDVDRLIVEEGLGEDLERQEVTSREVWNRDSTMRVELQMAIPPDLLLRARRFQRWALIAMFGPRMVGRSFVWDASSMAARRGPTSKTMW